MDWYEWVIIVIGTISSFLYAYFYFFKDWFEYKKAKKEIFNFVKSYKRRCTGNNRFVVTVESLQDSFHSYNTKVITNVWIDLVNDRVIEQDAQDQEWCVK
jgi:hypothetical protein